MITNLNRVYKSKMICHFKLFLLVEKMQKIIILIVYLGQNQLKKKFSMKPNHLFNNHLMDITYAFLHTDKQVLEKHTLCKAKIMIMDLLGDLLMNYFHLLIKISHSSR